MYAQRRDRLRVFEQDPDLLEDLDPRLASRLAAAVTVPYLEFRSGPWDSDAVGAAQPGDFGLLVLDGLVARSVGLGSHACTELLGSGDLLRPWDEGEGLADSPGTWRVLKPATLASLDARFATETARWPSIAAALLARSARRSRALMCQAALAQVRHADTRVLLMLWQLAERWGRVTPRGVWIPFAITHQLLADLTFLRRPTVSTALSSLAARHEVSRLADGEWLLSGEPPTPPLEDAASWSSLERQAAA